MQGFKRKTKIYVSEQKQSL